MDLGGRAAIRGDEIRELVEASNEAEIYSGIEILDEEQTVVLYFLEEPSPETLAAIEKITDGLTVDYRFDSLLTDDQFVTKADRMIAAIGAEKFGFISPNNALTKAAVSVWYAEDQEETAAQIKQHLLPLQVEIIFQDRPVDVGYY